MEENAAWVSGRQGANKMGGPRGDIHDEIPNRKVFYAKIMCNSLTQFALPAFG